MTACLLAVIGGVSRYKQWPYHRAWQMLNHGHMILNGSAELILGPQGKAHASSCRYSRAEMTIKIAV